MAFPHDGVKFQPGESGNPDGAPKRPHIKTLAKRLANDPETWKYLPANVDEFRKKVGDDKSVLEALVLSWLTKAKDDPRWGNIILELLDGKGPIKVKHSGSIGKHMSEEELDNVIRRYEEAVSGRQSSQS